MNRNPERSAKSVFTSEKVVLFNSPNRKLIRKVLSYSGSHLKSHAKAWLFYAPESRQTALPAIGRERRSDVFVCAHKIPLRTRQKPRARPAEKFRQEFYRKASRGEPFKKPRESVAFLCPAGGPADGE